MGHEGHDHPPGPFGPGQLEIVPPRDSGPVSQVAAFVVTCSDTYGVDLDETGALIKATLRAAGHSVTRHEVIRKNSEAVRAALEEAVESGARAVIFNGGTGLGKKDGTLETLEELFEKELPGFGESLRAHSSRQAGLGALFTRASAGTYRGVVIFALPNSPPLARWAVESLIAPELGRAVRELTGF